MKQFAKDLRQQLPRQWIERHRLDDESLERLLSAIVWKMVDDAARGQLRMTVPHLGRFCSNKRHLKFTHSNNGKALLDGPTHDTDR